MEAYPETKAVRDFVKLRRLNQITYDEVKNLYILATGRVPTRIKRVDDRIIINYESGGTVWSEIFLSGSMSCIEDIPALNTGRSIDFLRSIGILTPMTGYFKENKPVHLSEADIIEYKWVIFEEPIKN